MFDNFDKIKCDIKVTSKLGIKHITADLNSYVKLERYDNIIEFLKRNKRELARLWTIEGYEPIGISEIFHNERLYEKFIELYIFQDYALDFDSLFSPFYSMQSYRPNAGYALINIRKSENVNYTDLIQNLLNQYGYINDAPKYQLNSTLNLPYKAIV